MNYAGSTCICRVPKAHLKDGIVVECTHCGKSPPRPETTIRPTMARSSQALMLSVCVQAAEGAHRATRWADRGAGECTAGCERGWRRRGEAM